MSTTGTRLRGMSTLVTHGRGFYRCRGALFLRVTTRSLSSTSCRERSGVRILEVAARDGLQNIKTTIPTATKIELIRRLADTGLQHIEATSFVSPKWVPQLADGAAVMEKVLPLASKGITLPVLAPNMKGFENAVKAGAQEVEVFASATEAFSKANQNCSVEEALIGAQKVVTAAKQSGVRARGVISCIFSDPYSGPTDPYAVLRVVKRFLDMGCYEVGLGDTLGVGTPAQTKKLLEVLLSEVPADKLAGHFHDTYGQGVANVVAAYSMGIRAFDTSVAGAKGNVASEDVIYTLENSGISTGVDLNKLISVGEWISREIGMPYGSRAGAALLAKRNMATATEKSATKDKPTREWTTVTELPDYRVSRSGAVVRITMTRAQHGNTMTAPMLEGLTKLFTDLANCQDTFHIVLEAEGRFFCTGMDLSGGTKTTNTDKEHGYHAKIQALFSAIDNCPQTTIALINGPCYGGGVGLGFVCDVRLASTNARWTLSEIKIGVAPAIISRYMAREWGIPFFREAMLSGREVHYSELERIGAIHGVSDDTSKLLEDYLDKLAHCAPRSASICKELVRLAWHDAGSPRQDKFIEDTFHGMMIPGSEGEYGIQQFQKKNKNIQWAEFWSQEKSAS
ncbi:uncharacterized protein N7503_000992 [Penicillium pulvis]|uniref:uncharacterized protein n=1 Tax=Penicillium pulvis TaxID=1562058 RepID=UPI002547595C|nr:uncharacterized protein N7503_000992 [Penicillium pulvis]KAJ5814242.1 hypothetical protein N7503_000992 [Penicillium pulvis]